MDYSRLQSHTPHAAPRQTVLVVDDDADLRDAMAVLLEREGYDVVDASNGQDALAYLRSGADIAVIVLDLAMPVMNGWQFLAERQRDPNLSKIPTLVVTGNADVMKRRKELGNLPVFTKPIHFDELYAALRQALESGRVKKPNVLGF